MLPLCCSVCPHRSMRSLEARAETLWLCVSAKPQLIASSQYAMIQPCRSVLLALPPFAIEHLTALPPHPQHGAVSNAIPAASPLGWNNRENGERTRSSPRCSTGSGRRRGHWRSRYSRDPGRHAAAGALARTASPSRSTTCHACRPLDRVKKVNLKSFCNNQSQILFTKTSAGTSGTQIHDVILSFFLLACQRPAHRFSHTCAHTHNLCFRTLT